MSRRRLVLYLLLNALVSLLVSGTILYFYDRAKPKADCGTIESIPTLVSGTVKADIISVTGTGVLADESVIIQNSSDTPLVLTGWTLKNSQEITYTFPQLTLYPGGNIQVHTGSGTDSSANLYWAYSTPVWKSGELAALYDTQNIARSFYRIP
jgi:hypothetical protein